MSELLSLLEQLAPLVIQPVVIILYVVFLGVIFVRSLWRFWRQYVRAHKGVKEGKALIEGMDKEGFRAEFTRLDKELQSNGVFGEAWNQFVQCLVFPPEEEKAVQSSRDARDYFHASSVIDRHLEMRYHNAVPNILTGLGILGTFIGLAAGIGVAQTGLREGDMQLMQIALGDLLGGASLAFVTSIAGLLLSIAFLWIERGRLNRLKGNVQEFVRHLDRCLDRLTPERLLTDHLVELKEQSNQLKQFNTELAFQIAEALDEKVAGRLAPAMEKLLAAVNELKENQQSSSEEAIRSLVEEFRSSMSGATDQEFDRISGTLRQIDEAMSRTAEQFSQREASLQESVKELLDEIGGTLQRNSRQMQSEVEDSIQTLLQGVSGSMKELQTTVAEGRANTQAALETASERAALEMDANLRKSSEAMAEAAAGITEKFSTAGASLSEELSRSTQGLGEDLSGLREHVREVKSLVEAVGAAASRLTDASRGSEEIVRRLGELEGVLRSAAQEIGQGSRSTGAAAEVIRSGMEKVQEAIVELNENQRHTASAWTDYRERFEGLDHSLRKTFEELDSGISRYTEQVNTFQSGMDKSMEKAVESLGGAVRDLEEILEDFTDRAQVP